MWEPRRLTTLWASTACYTDNSAFKLCIYHQGIRRHIEVKQDSNEILMNAVSWFGFLGSYGDAVFDVAPCFLVEVYRRFGGTR
jgi:hypothetical protein